MGWQLTATVTRAASEIPEAAGSAQPIIVALIAALGPILVIIVTWALSGRPTRTSNSPPIPDARLGERVAVAESLIGADQRTLDALDKYLRGLDREVDERLDKLTFRVATIEGWRDSHRDWHSKEQP